MVVVAGDGEVLMKSRKSASVTLTGLLSACDFADIIVLSHKSSIVFQANSPGGKPTVATSSSVYWFSYNYVSVEVTMTSRKRIGLILLWALSLIIAGAFAHAQTIQREIVVVPQGKILPATVKSGADIGFSVQREGRDGVQGTLVVKINGEWVPAEPIERVKY